MALVLQRQRYAIEELLPQLTELKLHEGQRFFLDGREVFFRGISKGEGTCSRVHGVDIAVFSAYPNRRPDLPKKAVTVVGAIFVRDSDPNHPEERLGATGNESDIVNDAIKMVEALAWSKVEPQLIQFERTGHKQPYINL